MRNYSIFTPQRWIGATGKQLRRGIKDRKPGDPEREAYKDAQIMADVLVNNPNANQYGLYYMTVAAMSDLTGLFPDEIRAALVILERCEFAFYDEASEFTWVKEMARVQLFLPFKPGDRQVKAANTWYRHLPRNPYLAQFFDRYAEDLRLEQRRDEWAQRGGRLPLEPSAPAAADATPGKPYGFEEMSLFQQWFLIFLEAYPSARRVGGAAGEASFARAMRGRGEEHLNVMLDALWFQRKSAQWREGVIPAMTKWLDEQHWTRDLPAGKNHAGGAKGFECPSGHTDCASPGAHALRVALEQQCRHEPACRSFLEHHNQEVESA